MTTITKKDLVDRVASSTGEKRLLAKDILQQLLDDIATELARGNRIQLRDLASSKSSNGLEEQPKILRPSRRSECRPGKPSSSGPGG